jgi:alpha-galactosidase
MTPTSRYVGGGSTEGGHSCRHIVEKETGMTEQAPNGQTPTGSDVHRGWTPRDLDIDSITTGDMPGDKVQVNQSHIDKATTIFPHLMEALDHHHGRLVVSVYGGSGVGKSEIASVLGAYCRQEGWAPYILSGDNYPHRVPEVNDLERLMVFRNAALNALARDAGFSEARMSRLHDQWPSMDDLTPPSGSDEEHEWMATYHHAGREALDDYLGTERESDFSMVNDIVASFKRGADHLNLKRMGRSTDDIRFETVDVSQVRILIIEWTHGNNPRLEGVDFPIFLFSTPAETLAHRLARGRDANADSPLIALVLEIEQEKLLSQADRAALIISKRGEVLSLPELQHRLAEATP